MKTTLKKAREISEQEKPAIPKNRTRIYVKKSFLMSDRQKLIE